MKNIKKSEFKDDFIILIKNIMETELNQRLQKLENKMDQILKLLNKNEDKKVTVKEDKPAKPKVERKPSAFNQFMKKQIESLKTEKPDLDHKSRFKMASEMWATSTDNPKNNA
jgi:hypothetical protein